MIDSCIVDVPNASGILLRCGDAGISVEHINDCIHGVRKCWNPYPCDDGAIDRIIFLNFIIQFGNTTWIGSEDNIVTVRAGYFTTVSYRGKSRLICSAEQEWKVGLIRICNLRMVDNDFALIVVSSRRTLRGRNRDRK